jgi:uncharacterized repeat protein (TIGR03803 family)
MSSKHTFLLARFVVVVASLAIPAGTSWAAGVKETILYTFTRAGSTGDFPAGALVADKAGNLYGTTALGGNLNPGCYEDGCGTVYELTPPTQQGGSWTETVLYAFEGSSDGGEPQCTLVIDDSGNLYGTSGVGGATGHGTVFELSPPPQPGDPWTESVLFDFSSPAFNPFQNQSDLLRDSAGNLYGATYMGGDQDDGTVFEVSPPAQPGGQWTGTILYSFKGGSDGAAPLGRLIRDGRGALYGTTFYGGNKACRLGCGTVFQLLPPSQQQGSWSENVLYAFNGDDGQNASGGLVADKQENLYGTTYTGGQPSIGNVFELSPPRQLGGAWTETVLYHFQGHGDGKYPDSRLVMDKRGDLFGTTEHGGHDEEGVVFELLHPQPGGVWTERHFRLEVAIVMPIGGLLLRGDEVIGTGCNDFGGGGVFSIGR